MKILDIIKKWFNSKSKRTKMLEEKNEEIELIKENERELFVKSIRQKEEIELQNLQKKLENGQISVNSINIFKVMDLLDKYENKAVN